MSEAGAVPFSQRLILHIGPHKTGSTAIQNFFFERGARLSERGVLYPEAGRHPDFPNQHWLFGDAVARGDESYLKPFVAQLTAEIEARAPHTIVLSTETLARQGIGPKHFERVLALFPHARIEWALLLRAPLGLAKSRYSEQVRQGLLRYPEKIADMVDDRFLDQLGRIRALAELSRDAPIRIASFDAIKGALVEHFLRMLDLADSFDPDWHDRSTHESLPASAIELFRYVNWLPERVAGPLRWRITRLVWRNESWLPRLRRNLDGLDAALEPYWADCRAMERLFFDGQDAGLVPPDRATGDIDAIVAANAPLASRVLAYHPGRIPVSGDPRG